jgi:hypothetical protein
LAVQRDAVAGEDLALPIERQPVLELEPWVPT